MRTDIQTVDERNLSTIEIQNPMTASEIDELRTKLGFSQVVVQKQSTPWPWIIGGPCVLLGMLMVFSFFYAMYDTSLKAAADNADRAHQLAEHAITAMGEAQASSAPAFDPSGYGLVFIMGLVGTGFVLRGMVKVFIRRGF